MRQAAQNYFLISCYQEKLGQMLLALESIEKFLRLDPRSSPAHWQRGRFLISLKRYRLAAAAFGRAIALEPQNPVFWKDRAYAFWYQGKRNLALGDLRRSLSLNPGNTALETQYALWNQADGNPDFLSRNDFVRGCFYFRKKEYSKAERIFRRSESTGKEFEMVPVIPALRYSVMARAMGFLRKKQ